jgi:ankyrin repeat protein
MVRLLLEYGSNVDVSDKDSATPLIQAIRFWVELDTIRLLLDNHGAAVNIPDNDGFTPLLLTVEYGQVEATRLLLEEYGADPNISDMEGMTTLHRVIASFGPLKIVRLLLEHGASVTLPIKTAPRPSYGPC